MAGDTTITIIGNLTADPELRFTQAGAAVANFTVASTPRTFNRATGDWEDGEALFMRCTIWKQAAENVAESLTRGARVVVHGRLKQRSFQTKEGEKRTVVELDVDEIGPSLRYATATVTKNAKNATSAVNPDRVTSTPAAPVDDPWGPAGEQELVGAGAGAGDKPPF
ncbi:single-stranded DNA-binding protein [Amycolatopsis sp. NPDC088138]|uniref:single-stranded DNA-binding protein n=1 Tax=Amycolatopsis sp. NPDC088138 TaxID=3363938 RepID=UPI0038103EC1